MPLTIEQLKSISRGQPVAVPVFEDELINTDIKGRVFKDDDNSRYEYIDNIIDKKPLTTGGLIDPAELIDASPSRMWFDTNIAPPTGDFTWISLIEIPPDFSESKYNSHGCDGFNYALNSHNNVLRLHLTYGNRIFNPITIPDNLAQKIRGQIVAFTWVKKWDRFEIRLNDTIILTSIGRNEVLPVTPTIMIGSRDITSENEFSGLKYGWQLLLNKAVSHEMLFKLTSQPENVLNYVDAENILLEIPFIKPEITSIARNRFHENRISNRLLNFNGIMTDVGSGNTVTHDNDSKTITYHLKRTTERTHIPMSTYPVTDPTKLYKFKVTITTDVQFELMRLEGRKPIDINTIVPVGETVYEWCSYPNPVYGFRLTANGIDLGTYPATINYTLDVTEVDDGVIKLSHLGFLNGAGASGAGNSITADPVNSSHTLVMASAGGNSYSPQSVYQNLDINKFYEVNVEVITDNQFVVHRIETAGSNVTPGTMSPGINRISFIAKPEEHNGTGRFLFMVDGSTQFGFIATVKWDIKPIIPDTDIFTESIYGFQEEILDINEIDKLGMVKLNAV